jgi:hypothetical protein
MAKKQLKDYKFVPGNVVPDTALYPNATALLNANKKFIQEETIAYIAYNVANNIAPYLYYTYNAEKCRRDVSYVIEGYISDLRHGGNRVTVNNAAKYFENGVAQVDGTRQPEIYAHTFIRDLIQQFILANVAFSAKQGTVSQVINNAYVAEVAGYTKLNDLANIVINVITNGLTSLPAVVSNRGYLKIPGFYKLRDFLLITNVSRNIILYNFADNTAAAEVTYSENFDSDFPGALYAADKITTITFDIDTSDMMITDNIQVFIESKDQTVRFNSIATDAMERQKVGLPQSMLDADFEYGLQPTKWQAIGLMRNYPAVYEIPASDTAVISVTTDASTGTSGVGSSLITVTTSANHGFTVGTPITVKALANSISGFSRAEGTFLINVVPSNTSFNYYAKSKVGTADGQQLSSTYTQIRKGAFYTGASVGTPTFTVYSNGSAGTIATALATPSGTDTVGFSGVAPPLGAPMSGTGINTGTQVTAINGTGGTAATTTLTTSAAIGDTSVIVDSTTNIVPGLVFDRGDGQAIQVTNIVGSQVYFNAALTSTILGSTQSYAGQTQSSTTGTGTGSIFTVSRNGASYVTTVTDPGNGYAAGDTITVSGTGLGGTSSNNASITVSTASDKNTVASLNQDSISSIDQGYTTTTNLATTGGSGTGLRVDVTADGNGEVIAVAVRTPGKNYAVGNTITIVSGTARGVVYGYTGTIPAGTGYTTATGVATTTNGSGTGLTVNINCEGAGGANTLQITSGGTGYSSANGVSVTGGTGNSLTLNTVANAGVITNVSLSNKGTGYSVNDIVTVSGGGGNATIRITAITNREISGFSFNNGGQGYAVGDTFTVTQAGSGNNATFAVRLVTRNATIQVATLGTGGLIQSVSTTGTPITAPSKNFISSVVFSDSITQALPATTTLTFSAIATVQVDFSSAHGFVPGDSITVDITSNGSNASLASGPYYVEQVPTLTSLRYTARTSGTIANTLTGTVYGRPDSFFIHRPFDGGVQLGTASPSHGAMAIRMSKKYIRYQSGKGVMYNTGALFAPSYDLRSLTATSTAIGAVITINTDDTDHACQVGAEVTINGVVTSGYNGVYRVNDVIDERTFNVIATNVLGSTTAVLGNPCQMSLRNWHGATVRAGTFDDQNGMFWQYDGRQLSVGRRSSTFQIAGTVSVARDSNLVTGSSTRFIQQLAAGDRVVIRGMSHVVTSITDNTTMTIAPDYRGVSNLVQGKICKTTDLLIPQEAWNIDPCNGSGASGYNIDVTKMQMIGMQWTWYGAGFIDFMLRGSDGNYVFVHRFRNSNTNTEAYMRTGNQPVRYEVINEGAKDKLSADISDIATTIPLSDTTYFPDAGTVYIDNELIRYTGRTTTALTGATRASNMTQFVAGSQRNFSAGSAISHTAGTGVILVSNTVSPIISHWGSAFMTDGRFDDDRGYIFNYAATGISASVDKATAFLIRLAPSVSNAQTGDLGDKELLNRAQLLLQSIAIASDSVSGGGGIVVEGVLNPQNYPVDPNNITWGGLSNAAAGGQPSFAQIAPGGSVVWGGNASTSTATINGAFSTQVRAVSFSTVTGTIPAQGFATVNQFVTIVGNNGSVIQAASNLRNTVYITNAAYDALTTPIVVGDTIWANGYTNVVPITSVTRAVNGTGYTMITMSVNSVNSSTAGANITNVQIQSTIANNYSSAISSSRTDFLVSNTAYASSGLRVGDVLSLTSYITASQTVSTVQTSAYTIGGVAYTRITMSGVANGTTAAGSFATTTVNYNSIASITYAAALSTTRSDFLITDAEYNISSIAVGDTLSMTTNITASQTISSITTGYTIVSGVSYTRIVMSAVANGTTTTGSGNNAAVNVTAAGSSSAYNKTNYLFFTQSTWDASLATIGTKVASDQTQFPAGTFVSAITTRKFGARSITVTNATGTGSVVTLTYATQATAPFTVGSPITVSGIVSGSGNYNGNYVVISCSTTQVTYSHTANGTYTSGGNITGTTVYRVAFTQSLNTSVNAASTLKFQFGAAYALPGEQVFSFITNPGNTDNLSLEQLKELTNTTLGGRGTFPNGPDVLAINVYKVSGTATPVNIVLRWGEAQA